MNLPIVPGSDGAGTVEAVGKGVTRFKPGGTYTHQHLLTPNIHLLLAHTYPNIQ